MQHRLARAWIRRGLVAWLLWPVSLLYGLAIAMRHWLFREGIEETHRLPVRVIVVGNVVAGGAGKTPVVMALVNHLRAQGVKTGVISRGYGRSTRDCREVLSISTAQDAGDEPLLIQRLTHAPVFVATQRVQAARALLAKYPETQVIVSDDGLQHYALQRDLEICVFDDRGLGNGFLLPAGPLREPWPRKLMQSKTTRAYPPGVLLWPPIPTLLLHAGSQPAFNGGMRAARALAHHALRSDGSSVQLADLRGQPLTAVAGIANPTQFFDMLRDQGLTLSHTESFPDHYDYNSWKPIKDVENTVICTEKDAVKLWQVVPGEPTNVLAVPLVITLDAPFLTAVNLALANAAKRTGLK